MTEVDGMNILDFVGVGKKEAHGVHKRIQKLVDESKCFDEIFKKLNLKAEARLFQIGFLTGLCLGRKIEQNETMGLMMGLVAKKGGDKHD